MTTQLPRQSSDPTDLPAWQALQDHAGEMQALHLRDLIGQPRRYRQFCAETEQFVLDYSRQRMTGKTLELLLDLARDRALEQWVDALFSGAPVNTTENQPALHTALRSRPGDDQPVSEPLHVDGEDVRAVVSKERSRMLRLAARIRAGDYTGVTGAPVTDVVNIGIGGSDLGLVMATEALRPFCTRKIASHFVSNIDGTQLADVLEKLDPSTTLFIICSKSFTTLETRLNAESARAWLLRDLPEEAVGKHFMAVSVNAAAMDAFGIGADNRFMMWDWVGGRYSMWSSIGLILAIAIGPEQFQALLQGACELDEHFRTAAPEDNLPVLLGLVGVWNRNFLGMNSHVVLPYDQRLHRFPAFLQQLEMESLGKGVTRDGKPAGYTTGTVIWGEPGSNAQHSFFQLLHQGTSRFSADFIAPVQASSEYADQHQAGLANMLAQAEALALGQSEDDVPAHKVYPGNHPSSILLFKMLDPRTLGYLVALYEQAVFVRSVIWGVNPFDQWGVELGKTMARGMQQALSSTGEAPGIIEKIKAWRRP